MGTSTNGRFGFTGLSKSLASVCSALLVAGLTACAASGPVSGGLSDEAAAGVSQGATVTATRDAYLTPTGTGDLGYGSFSRHVNGTTGLLGIMLKSYATDPIVRPISTARSLGFLVKNTLTDFAKQTYISMFRLPEVTNRPLQPLVDGPGMNLAEWELELDRITGTPASTGTLEFLVDGDQYFRSLIETIEGADESVHLRTYIFDNDDFAIRIADLLKRRSEEIDIRVQMDGFGTLTGGLAMSGSMPATFEPPVSIAEYLQSNSAVNVRTMTNPWFTGDHAKVTVVDREVAFVGGMNIGREYRFDWHDLMVKVEGPVVEELARDSDNAWDRSGMLGDLASLFRSFSESGAETREQGYPIRILYTRPHDSQIYEAQLAAIRRARNFIYIENPYFSDDNILVELIAARRRGVDVRFVAAEKGDAAIMDMSNAHAINKMLDNGIRVYMYPRMTHVKAMIVDDWIMLGSANLDKLSLRVNGEVNIATSHPEAVSELKERLFRTDFEISTELERTLPTGPGYHLAEVVADLFL